jgi:hypothetical protein
MFSKMIVFEGGVTHGIPDKFSMLQIREEMA